MFRILDRQAAAIHGDGDQVTEAVVARRVARDRRLFHRPDLRRHAGASEKGMEVAVLAIAMGVIVVLRVGFRIVDIAWRAMVELAEQAVLRQQLADDVGAGPGQHPMTLDHLPPGRRHRLEPTGIERAEFDLRHLSLAAHAITRHTPTFPRRGPANPGA